MRPRQHRLIDAHKEYPAAMAITLSTLSRSSAIALLIGGTVALSACASGGQRPRADLAASQVTTIGVNAYLWRASLDALSFAPLLQADANGGVIITDWYANPQNPGERVKLTVAILDRDLRADALRVSGARQVAQAGAWVDAPIQAATVQRVEEIILTRARDLRRTAIAD
jgi:Domain of unknown function (DUF3576)